MPCGDSVLLHSRGSRALVRGAREDGLEVALRPRGVTLGHLHRCQLVLRVLQSDVKHQPRLGRLCLVRGLRAVVSLRCEPQGRRQGGQPVGG